MPSYATPPTLTDDVVLFASKEAANAFFALFEIPEADAASGEKGVVSQAPLVTYNFNELNDTTYANVIIINQDNSQSLVQVASKASYDQLVVEFNTLQASYNDLLTKLKAAGVVASA